MEQQIKDLYAGSDFVLARGLLTELPELGYHIYGSAGQPGERRGVEGTFTYTLTGTLEKPDLWKDYDCKLVVNSLGSAFRENLEPKGFVGDGWCEDRLVLFRLYVQPLVARSILDKFFVFEERLYYPHDEESFERSVRCDLERLAPGKHLLDGAITYKIVRVYC